MNIQGLANLIKGNAKRNAPAYLTAGACIGVISTVYFAIRDTRKAVRVLDVWEEENGVSDDPRERFLDRARIVLPIYTPTVVSSAVTIASIIGANRLSSKDIIAAQSVTAITQKAFSDYRDQVREVIGEKKDQEILGKVAEKRIEENPPPAIITGSGHVLCCELFTGRYFMSDVESLRKAQNTLNNKMMSQDYQTVADFQYLIGLPPTSNSHNIGWRVGRLMELEISAILTSDDKPCLAFDYNYTVPV